MNRIDAYRQKIRGDLQACANQSETPLLDTPQEKYCAKTVLLDAKGGLENWDFGFSLDFIYVRPARNALLGNVDEALKSLSKENSKSLNFFVHAVSTYTFLSPLSSGGMGVFTIYQGGGPTHFGRGIYDIGPTLDQIITLSFNEWQEIVTPFKERPPGSAEEERRTLGQVMARFEEIAGAKGGTSDDKGELSGNSVLALECDFTGRGMVVACKNGPDSVRRGQQDCVDEYRTLGQLLSALQVWGLLQHHTFANEIERTFIDEAFYSHYALTIREKTDPSKVWIIDSWPRDNGHLPDILPVQVWRAKYSSQGHRF